MVGRSLSFKLAESVLPSTAPDYRVPLELRTRTRGGTTGIRVHPAPVGTLRLGVFPSSLARQHIPDEQHEGRPSEKRCSQDNRKQSPFLDHRPSP